MCVTPAASAASSCSSLSTSTTTGTSAGAAASACASVFPWAARRAHWLSFQSTASASEARFSTPPPIRTAYSSSARRPGVVLRVWVIRAPVPATASTARRVSVAIPESRCRKLRATRSPPSTARADARTVARVAPVSTQPPSAIRASSSAHASSSRNTSAATAIPATTNRPSATNRAAASPAATPSRRVVTSSRARSSASARRTSSRPRTSANREHPLDGAARLGGGLGRHLHRVLQVAERVPQVFESDHLHVAALGRLGHGVELFLGVLATQAVQHARLRRHHELPRARSAGPLHHLLGRDDAGPAGGDVTIRLGVIHGARDAAALRVNQKFGVRMLAALALEHVHVRGQRRVHVALPHPDVERASRDAPQVIPEEEVWEKQHRHVPRQRVDHGDGVPRGAAVVRLRL